MEIEKSTCKTPNESNPSKLIGNRFQLGPLIGKGSFGKIFDATDVITGKHVAVKFEMRDANGNSHLRNEFEVYKLLSGGVGIPNLKCFGQTEKHDYLVLELLGPSLERLYNYCNRKFSMRTVLRIGIKMVRRIEYVHQMSHIHRDIKPDNFVIDSGRGDEIYLLDFGLAKRYSAIVNGKVEHVKQMQSKQFTGTVRYASINTQKCITPSRRDDLESLAYVLIYFLKGSLPWQHVTRTGITSKQRKERILEMKLSTTCSQLCAGLPCEFYHFLENCRSIGFADQPKYSYLRMLLENVFTRCHYDSNFSYDWIVKSNADSKAK